MGERRDGMGGSTEFQVGHMPGIELKELDTNTPEAVSEMLFLAEENILIEQEGL